ncbi:MAG: hypothetical protein ACU837_11560 [Gammaproteobacteria bacterium]
MSVIKHAKNHIGSWVPLGSFIRTGMLLLAAVLGSTSVGATDNVSPQVEKFAKVKQIRVEGIQNKLAILQKALNCVNNASDSKQMKSCEDTEKQALQALTQQQKAKREALKQQN